MPEYVRSVRITVTIDTNKRTIEKIFDNVRDAINYLVKQASNAQ